MDFAIDDSSSVDIDKVLFLFPDPDSFLPSIASLSVRLTSSLLRIISHFQRDKGGNKTKYEHGSFQVPW